MMANLARSMAFFATLVALSISVPPLATGEPGTGGSCVLGICKVEAERAPTKGHIRNKPLTQQSDRTSSRGSGSDTRSSAQRDFDADFAAYQKDVDAFRSCMAQGESICALPDPPIRVTLLGGNESNAGGGAPAVTITPGQAGAIAVARLKLPTVGPGIGPSPELNRWKMAAVGYPLWLWAEGPGQVGPVSDSVAGLNVSLRAEVSSLTFRMGDGTTVTCDGTGDRWTEAVEPGTHAPACGHTYTKPSLPKGNYTVAAVATWAVTWTANGQSGVINVPAVQSTELPVGELQVLVR